QDLTQLYQKHPELWEADGDPSGFSWIEVDNAAENVVVFRRIAPSTGKEVICVGNFSPVVREGHRLGLPRKGTYKQILNTDNEKYCGGGFGVIKNGRNGKIPWGGFDYLAATTLPSPRWMWFEGPSSKQRPTSTQRVFDSPASNASAAASRLRRIPLDTC